MIPHSTRYRSLANRTLDQLFEVIEDEAVFTLGLSNPLKDIPVTAATDRVVFEEMATVILAYSEIGVSYQLHIKDTAATDNASAEAVGDPVEGIGAELRLMSEPITEDVDFVVKATKVVGGATVELWMDQEVRITVGVDVDIPVLLENEEINYGEIVRVILPQSQAGIAYRLFNENDELIGGPIIGNEGEIMIQSAGAPGRLEEDTSLTIRAIRNSETGDGQALSIMPRVRVRANPALVLLPSPNVVDHGAAVSLRLQDSQSSVQYSLHWRPLDELEYWHNQTGTPPGPVSTIPAVLPDPLPANITPIPNIEILSPTPISNGQIPSFFEATGSPSFGNDGELILPTDGLTRDCLIFVLAEKSGHDQAVVLEAFKFGLSRPRTDIQIVAIPNPVSSGNRTEIQLSNVEAGVRYYLLDDANNLTGASTYMPLQAGEIEGNPAPNTLGRLKVGVNFMTGPVPEEPLILNSPALTENTSFSVMAVKSETLLASTMASEVAVNVN